MKNTCLNCRSWRLVDGPFQEIDDTTTWQGICCNTDTRERSNIKQTDSDFGCIFFDKNEYHEQSSERHHPGTE